VAFSQLLSASNSFSTGALSRTLLLKAPSDPLAGLRGTRLLRRREWEVREREGSGREGKGEEEREKERKRREGRGEEGKREGEMKGRKGGKRGEGGAGTGPLTQIPGSVPVGDMF